MNGKQAQPAVADAPTAAVRAAGYRGEPRSPNGPSGVHIRSVATEGPNERCYRGFGVNDWRNPIRFAWGTTAQSSAI